MPVTSRRAPDCGRPAARVWQSYRKVSELFGDSPVKAACGNPLALPVFNIGSDGKGKPMPNNEEYFQASTNLPLIDINGNWTIFERRVNDIEASYLLSPNGQASQTLTTMAGQTAFIAANPDGVQFTASATVPGGGNGSIEIKAAWRIIDRAKGDDSSRYYTQNALLAVPGDLVRGGKPFCSPVTVGLVGMHILQRNPVDANNPELLPQWMWATFEHSDNAPLAQSPCNVRNGCGTDPKKWINQASCGSAAPAKSVRYSFFRQDAAITGTNIAPVALFQEGAEAARAEYRFKTQYPWNPQQPYAHGATSAATRDTASHPLLGDLFDDGSAQYTVASRARQNQQRVQKLHADRHAMGRAGGTRRTAEPGAGQGRAGHAVEHHAGDLHPELYRHRSQPAGSGLMRRLPQLRDLAGRQQDLGEFQLPAVAGAAGYGPRKNQDRAMRHLRKSFGRRLGLPRIVAALVIVAGAALVVAIASLGGTMAAGGRASSTADIIWLVILIAAAVLFYWIVFRVHRLNPAWIGLAHARHLPAIPFRLADLPQTILGLTRRQAQLEQAVNGLSTVWTIGEITDNAYTFMGMGGGATSDPRTRLALDKPGQFAMSWTTLGGVYADASRDRLAAFAASLDDPDEATRQFWPTIARFGLDYNLIILRHARADDGRLKERLGADWTPRMEAVWQAGHLYVIDMTIFARFAPGSFNSVPRFTPATLTLLARDPATRAIAPFAVRVAGSSGASVLYAHGDPAWIYALQAAKASITVWGIWLGHVYHWHIVTAAMQMTMLQHLPAAHAVRQLFGRQSDYLIGFDQFLLLDWSIAPPTSFTTSKGFLSLLDAFAEGRQFFDDDPEVTLDQFGLRREDFTSGADGWDEYPVVRYVLALFDTTATYVGTVVEAFYGSDAAVASDQALQRWREASAAPGGGNIRGLPPLDSLAALKRVLTSLVFRVTAHGASRMSQGVNPVISFVPNFPPCLQDAHLPSPDTPIVFKADGLAPPGARSLSGFLPNTGSIGQLIAFSFIFIYSPPYKPFIPVGGIKTDLSFTGDPGIVDICNQALIQYRRDLQDFMALYASISNVAGPPAQLHQWPLNIET